MPITGPFRVRVGERLPSGRQSDLWRKATAAGRVLAWPGGPLGFWVVVARGKYEGGTRCRTRSNVKTTVGCALCCAPIYGCRLQPPLYILELHNVVSAVRDCRPEPGGRRQSLLHDCRSREEERIIHLCRKSFPSYFLVDTTAAAAFSRWA
jgi:hypothetical protein